MGQRHNRRRTRPRSHRANSIDEASAAALTAVIPPPGSPVAVIATIWSPQPTSCVHPSSATACISPGSPVLAASAPTWHYGSTDWKIPETTSQWDGEGFEAQRCRLFGGEPGDDVSLCYRMLEYFGGLDYIDSSRHSTLGD
ncbi:hypothetical protein N7462_005916 [Penicillium macrosclerotiorum]|uniref:uncharacterized protein n=1 Tax=Penicillium macrosclerotiorum TaxID=303699 RepID=UPI002548A5D4|nr:uncharacterized protein N7462_005916 [Penicillium macrosclerotiorum]KAJ5682751.1 hypothetical protein N7462_005916 [Penicillium macrosclerotiorum]